MTLIFVGRAAELRALRGELAAARRRRSRLVLLVGEPGVGKTRLLAEFGRATAREATWLVGRGSGLRATIPFGLLSEALESHLRTVPPAALATLCSRRLTELAGILPSVAAALPDSVPAAPTSRARTFEALLCLLTELADRQPLVLGLDDLHEGDPSTWELVDYLARNPIDAPILLIASVRSDRASVPGRLGQLLSTLLQDGLGTEVRLRALDRTAIGELATDARGLGQTSPETADWLFERSLGNPLFAVALLQELEGDPAGHVVPVSVKERVRAMTVRLSPQPRAVLQLAAVLGPTFSLRTIGSLLPAGEDQWLDELVALGLLAEHTGENGAAYDFVHPLIHEAVYEEMGAARRRRLHQQVAEGLTGASTTALAYHAARGALPGDDRAIELILGAARDAGRSQAHLETLAWLKQALDLIPPARARERAAVLDEIAAHAASAGDHRAGIAAIRELMSDHPLDATARGAAHIRLASFLATGAGDLAAAEREIQAAIRLFAGGEADDRLARAINELGWIRGEKGDVTGQIDESRRALGLAEAQGDRATVIHALGSLGHALGLQGREIEARAAIERSLLLVREDDDRSQIGWHAGTLAEILNCAGRFREAAAVIDPLIDAGSTDSDIAYAMGARTHWYLGSWRAAVSDCLAVQALHPNGPSIHSAWAHSFAGLLELLTGRADAAPPMLAQAERAYQGRPFYWFSAWHDWAVGMSSWQRGDAEGALPRLRAAADRAETMGATAIAAQILPDLTEVLAETGRSRDAADAAGRLAQLAERLQLPYLDSLHAYADGVVLEAAGRRAAAARSFEVASRGAEADGTPFLQARALEHLARAVSGQERLAALAQAGHLYTALPAPAHLERVATAMRGLGPAGRRTALAIGELTRREREVARLAADGLTTSEIAARLQVSDRTIETHLAHAFGKLGITRRHELAGRPELAVR